MGYYDNKDTRGAIDRLLFKLTSIEANQGIDSTDTEKLLADNEKQCVIKQIRDLDKKFYNDVFLIDKTEEE